MNDHIDIELGLPLSVGFFNEDEGRELTVRRHATKSLFAASAVWAVRIPYPYRSTKELQESIHFDGLIFWLAFFDRQLLLCAAVLLFGCKKRLCIHDKQVDWIPICKNRISSIALVALDSASLVWEVAAVVCCFGSLVGMNFFVDGDV